jgi:hypothetical protein
MTAMAEIPFYQVLLFHEEKSAQELGRVLWAALEEVAVLYNHGQQRAQFQRYFLAQKVPEGIKQGSGFNQEESRRVMASSNWWKAIGGWSPNLPPMDKEVMLNQVRQLLGGQAYDADLLVVTDLEIDPPEGWRYIIWDGIGNGTVASIKPLDPLYWGLWEKQRHSIIKHRLRTVCCSATGEHLGFERCRNPQCLLYNYVESVNHLDRMISFGKEHKVPDLTGLGFATESRNPAEVQPLLNLTDSLTLASDYPPMAGDFL